MGLTKKIRIRYEDKECEHVEYSNSPCISKDWNNEGTDLKCSPLLAADRARADAVTHTP